MSKGFLMALKMMIYDETFNDLADWNSIPKAFQDDFQVWLKEKSPDLIFFSGDLPWSMYRLEYIAQLIDREIENEFTQEERTPGPVAKQGDSQESISADGTAAGQHTT